MPEGRLYDGLYRVDHKGLCAGFVVEDGIITKIAPVLRKNIRFWLKKAKRISS
jgi:hypothetical protein